MNIFTTIKEKLGFLTKDKNTKIVITQVREESRDILEYIEFLRNEFRRLLGSKSYDFLRSNILKSPYYLTYLKHIPNMLLTMEKRQPLSSFAFILEKSYSELSYLEQFVKDRPDLSTEISIEDLSMSKMMILCVVNYFEAISEYCKAFLVLANLTVLDNIGSKTLGKYTDPLARDFPWMRLFINDMSGSLLNSLDSFMYSRNDKPGVLLNNLLISLKKINFDPKLMIDGKINTYFLDTVENSDLTVKNFFFYGTRWLNFYRHYQNIKMNYKHSKYLKRKHDKALIENYANLIRLKLEDMDENDPEYKKLLKVLDNYTDMINDLQKDIEGYENS